MTWLIIGVPKITGTCTAKFDKSRITRAIWSSSYPWTLSTWTHIMTQPKGRVNALPKPTQETHLNTKSDKGPTLRECSLTKFGVTVFICAPLSRMVIQLSLLILTLAMFLTPNYHRKGLGFKKGVCVLLPMLWASLPGVLLAQSPCLEGSGLPSLVLSPPFSLNG